MTVPVLMPQANRNVKQQENRLQAALQHRNEALAATGELRGRIEGLRREGLACKNILQKAQETLKVDQRTIINLLTESAAAAEQREAVVLPCSRYCIRKFCHAIAVGRLYRMRTQFELATHLDLYDLIRQSNEIRMTREAQAAGQNLVI